MMLTSHPDVARSGEDFLGSRSTATNVLAEQDTVVRVRGLMKAFGRRQAVRGIDLDVRRGEIFAFLGPNGAGKTTTVEILEGFLPRTAGEVSVLGLDPADADRSWRERVGVVLQESEPEPGLTVRECLRLYAGYYAAPRDVEDTICLVGLADQATTLASHLSGGQRRRLDVALALVGDPEIVFLDEPTTGFDPSARHAAWDVISGLRALGKTIFLTTHYMDEAELLADRIAVLARGQIVAEGTPQTLGGRHEMTTTIRFTIPAGLEARDLPACLAGLTQVGQDRAAELRSETPVLHLQTLTQWAISRDLDLVDLDVRRPTLEDVYLALTSPTPEGPR